MCRDIAASFTRYVISVARRFPKKANPQISEKGCLLRVADGVAILAQLLLAAEAIPKSEKLLRLQVDIGEKRTVVAGIARFYRPEDLVGKTVILLANLQPTKLMGVESQGMVLAADGKDGVVLATFDQEMQIGAKVR